MTGGTKSEEEWTATWNSDEELQFVRLQMEDETSL